MLIQVNKESKYTGVTLINICAKIRNKNYIYKILGQRNLISNTMRRKPREDVESFLRRFICRAGNKNNTSIHNV